MAAGVRQAAMATPGPLTFRHYIEQCCKKKNGWDVDLALLLYTVTREMRPLGSQAATLEFFHKEFLLLHLGSFV